MFRNYLTIAIRNLQKHRGHSFINIAGLAAGMAMALLIGLWIYDELSFDTYHENYNDIMQVMQQQTVDGSVVTEPPIPWPLETELHTKSNHTMGRSHSPADQKGYNHRIDAFDYLYNFGIGDLSGFLQTPLTFLEIPL